MLQTVRRPNPSPLASRAMPTVSRRRRYVEVAFIMLASANLFVLSSVGAFFFLAHKH
jgi:hypothetical protein